MNKMKRQTKLRDVCNTVRYKKEGAYMLLIKKSFKINKRDEVQPKRKKQPRSWVGNSL